MQDLIIGSTPLLIAFSVALFYYKKLEPSWFRLFPLFLFLMFSIQIGGYFYSAIFKKSNHFIFNCLTFIEYEFYIFIFSKALTKKVLKTIAIAINLLFIIAFVYIIFYRSHFFVYNTLVNNIGEFLTLCCCFLYLSELLMIEELASYFVIPMFWITTGIMISIVGDFLYLCFFNYIMENNLDPEGRVYGIIMTSLSVIEYGFFTIGFLCKTLWEKTR